MRRSRGLTFVGVAVVSALAWSCGGGTGASLDTSVATASVVRGSVAIADDEGTPEPLASTARVPLGGSVTASEAGLTRLVLDSGPSLLLDASASVALPEDAHVAVTSGRVFFDVMAGDAMTIDAAGASLRASDASMSITIDASGARVYVVRGEISHRTGDARGIVRAGEALAIAGATATVSPEALWIDWTGGLVRAGPIDPSSAPGMGTLEARVPDEVGQARWPLVIRRLDVQVEIVGELAITEVQEVFFNPASETVEGLYRVRVPEGAVLERFAVDRNGQLVEGYVREQAQARAAYEAQVYRGSTDDPALLEWDAPGSYRARIYPIGAGEVRRIAIRYAEWLPRAYEGGPRFYRYPMAGGAGAPHVGEFAFVANVAAADAARIRAGLGATVESDRVELRRSDFSPRSDLWLELTPRAADAQHAYQAAHTPPARAPGSRIVVNEADERDYWYLPLRLPESLFTSAETTGLDVVIVADVSAGTDRAHLELGRSVAEAVASHLGPNDRVTIVTSDLAIRALGEGDTALGEASPARIEALLDGLAEVPAGGATDLGTAIAEAGALLDPTRDGAVIYVGDGAPTVGELGADALIAHLREQPHPIRLYAVGVGADANLDLLAELTHGGGLSMRVEERDDAAEAAMDILAHLSRPVLTGVTVELGNAIENAFPRVPVDVVRGYTLEVSGRVRDTPPTDVIVRGSFHGTPVEQVVALTTIESDAGADLRLRWANERLRQQLREGATREEIAELGTRYGLITPYTSYYVPSARELGEMGGVGQLYLHPDLVGPRPSTPEGSHVLAEAALSLVLAPLALTACSSRAAEPPSETASMIFEEERSEDAPRADAVGAPAPPPPPIVVAPTTPAVTTPTTATTTAPAPEVAAAADARAQLAQLGYAMGPQAQPPADTGDLLGGSLGTEANATGIGGGGTGEGTIGLGNFGTIGHGSGDGTGSGYGYGSAAPTPRRSASHAPMHARSHHESDEPVEREERQRLRIIDAETEVHVASSTSSPSHARSRCSGASHLALADRRGLWDERLRAADYVGAWVDAYRQAGRDCELGSARDRREFLDALIDRAGSLARMIDVYTYLTDASARGFFRGAILRRVRTPADLRVVRGTFGLSSSFDWTLVEQVLARATTPAARLRALRELIVQQPDSFDLKLRLLEELEVQRRIPELRRLAERLRVDPLADPGVRTAIGEMYLRHDMEEDARRTFSEIVEFAPLDELARRRLGDLYRAHGWYEDAYRQYETLATIRPDDPSVLLLLAQAAAGAERTDEALRLEQRVMETAAPGARDGVARVAQLWSSVRFAQLRSAARDAGNDDQLSALGARMRRSGVLRNAGDLRVSLVWEHPDAEVSLWAAHPSTPLTRPEDLDAEFGIEAFEASERESGTYRIEVRRASADRVGTVTARLVVVWNEGRPDERIEIEALTFGPGVHAFAWTIDGTTRAEAEPTAVPALAAAPPRGR
jgi:tetratricopeptide (TPR) repeat protein